MSKPTQRRISFGVNSEKQDHDLPLTEEERRSVWYTADDLASFRTKALELTSSGSNNTAALLLAYHKNNNSTNNTEEDCLRGLESYISKDKTLKRRKYIGFVLNMQAQNRKSGMQDPMGLRACAVAQSKSAMEGALIRASKDAAEVFLQQEETNNNNTHYNNDNDHRKGAESAAAARDAEEDTSVSKHPHYYRRGLPATIHRPRKNKTTATVA